MDSVFVFISITVCWVESPVTAINVVLLIANIPFPIVNPKEISLTKVAINGCGLIVISHSLIVVDVVLVP